MNLDLDALAARRYITRNRNPDGLGSNTIGARSQRSAEGRMSSSRAHVPQLLFNRAGGMRAPGMATLRARIGKGGKTTSKRIEDAGWTVIRVC